MADTFQIRQLAAGHCDVLLADCFSALFCSVLYRLLHISTFPRPQDFLSFLDSIRLLSFSFSLQQPSDHHRVPPPHHPSPTMSPSLSAVESFSAPAQNFTFDGILSDFDGTIVDSTAGMSVLNYYGQLWVQAVRSAADYISSNQPLSSTGTSKCDRKCNDMSRAISTNPLFSQNCSRVRR
jgi:hypothetical protein